ncbi:hypothetical protein ILUMI_14487, partial [Ignelater luminosus]
VTDTATLLRHFGESSSVILQVLLICYWGEQLYFESGMVGLAAYESNFLETKLSHQRSIAFIIRRSQNPAQLTAGKFTVIGIETFAWAKHAGLESAIVIVIIAKVTNSHLVEASHLQ